MNVDVRKIKDIVIVDFNGRLVAGDGEEALGLVVSRLLAEHNKKILLNFSKVEFIDSTGLGVLVQSFKASQRAGASLKLLRPQDRVRKTLSLTKLLPLFEVHETETEALKSFNGS